MGYSQSKLNTYRDCPLKYKFAYVDRISTPGTIEQFVGSMVHEALEEFINVRCKCHRDLPYEDTCRIFDQKFDENFTDDLVVNKDYLTVEDHKVRGHEFIRKFYEIEARREPGEVLGVEKWINFSVGESSMGGYIDRLERIGNEFHIIDYKASDRPMSQEKADQDWQLAIYEMATREEFSDAEAVFLEWFYLGPGVVVSSVRTPEQLEDLEGEICTLIAEIENDTEFLPLGNNWCPCEYAEFCEEEKERRRLKACEVEPVIEDVARDYVRADTEMMALKARMRELDAEMAELGTKLVDACLALEAWSVEAGDHIIEVKSKAEYGIPKKGTDPRLELEQIVRDCGLWDEMSEVSKTAVLDGIRKQRFGTLNDALLALFEEKLKHSFKVLPSQPG